MQSWSYTKYFTEMVLVLNNWFCSNFEKVLMKSDIKKKLHRSFFPPSNKNCIFCQHFLKIIWVVVMIYEMHKLKLTIFNLGPTFISNNEIYKSHLITSQCYTWHMGLSLKCYLLFIYILQIQHQTSLISIFCICLKHKSKKYVCNAMMYV